MSGEFSAPQRLACGIRLEELFLLRETIFAAGLVLRVTRRKDRIGEVQLLGIRNLP